MEGQVHRYGTMTKTFPPDLQQFVRQEVANGHFRSEDDLLQEAVRLLRDRRLGYERLRQEVRARLESIDRFEGIHLDGDEALGAFFDGIEAEVEAERAARRHEGG